MSCVCTSSNPGNSTNIIIHRQLGQRGHRRRPAQDLAAVVLEGEAVGAAVGIHVGAVAAHAFEPAGADDAITQKHIAQLAHDGLLCLFEPHAERPSALGAQPRHAGALVPGQAEAVWYVEAGLVGPFDAVDDGLAVGRRDGGCLFVKKEDYASDLMANGQWPTYLADSMYEYRMK